MIYAALVTVAADISNFIVITENLVYHNKLNYPKNIKANNERRLSSLEHGV